MEAKVAASNGLTSNSNSRKTRVQKSAPRHPATTPANASRPPSYKTNPSTSRRPAPNAIRMPNQLALLCCRIGSSHFFRSAAGAKILIHPNIRLSGNHSPEGFIGRILQIR